MAAEGGEEFAPHPVLVGREIGENVLAVEGGGCSGFQYRFGFADAPEASDLVVETDGVRLVVDDVSLDLVRGASVDYVESLGGASFKVENPQAASGCGCGTSFSV